MIPLNLNRLGSQSVELDLEHQDSELKASGENMERGGKELLCMGVRKAKGKVQLEKINN